MDCCYQLSCGHWRSDDPSYDIGGMTHCVKCNAFRVLIIGMTTGLLPAGLEG